MRTMPLLLSVAVAALALSSCKKELEQVNNSPTAAPTSLLAKPALLAAGAWHQTGLTVSTAEGANQAATSDLFAYAKPTMLVTMAAYKADGTYSLMRGVRPGRPAAEPLAGTWHLNATADSLITTQAERTRRLAVAELTANTMRLTYSEVGANGHVSTYTSIFAH